MHTKPVACATPCRPSGLLVKYIEIYNIAFQTVAKISCHALIVDQWRGPRLRLALQVAWSELTTVFIIVAKLKSQYKIHKFKK